MISLTKLQFNALTIDEQVEFIHAQDNQTLDKMVEEGYIHTMTRDRLLRNRGEKLSPERQAELDEQYRKMALKLGAVAANVR